MSKNNSAQNRKDTPSRQELTESDIVTPKQLKSIPLILAARTIAEGCKAAKISRDTFYSWLKDLGFKAEFEAQRKAIIDIALHELKGLSGEAVKVLRELLKAENEGVRLRTATAIIENVMKSIEMEDINKRLDELERRIK
jgi:hypothetical protein